MRDMLYYSQIALRDTLRLRGSLFATSMIVLGICLPLVLLLGLTNGLVHQQEETMLRSPTACQMLLWVTGGKAPPFTQSVESQLTESHPEIALVIPSIKKVVD